MKSNRNLLCLVSAVSLSLFNILPAEGMNHDTATLLPAKVFKSTSSYINLSGGVSWTKSGKARTDVTLSAPLAVNRYEASRASQLAPLLGLGYGLLWSNLGTHKLNFSLGLETGYSRVLSALGRVRPLYKMNPNYDTLSFRYAVSSVPLLMLSTLQFPHGAWVPYVLGGLGVSWNRASNYQELPTNPASSAVPIRSPFKPQTVLSFAYTVGAGLSYRVSPQTEFGLEYRYANYGHAQLNPSKIQTTSDRLSLGNVSSHAVILRLTQLFA